MGKASGVLSSPKPSSPSGTAVPTRPIAACTQFSDSPRKCGTSPTISGWFQSVLVGGQWPRIGSQPLRGPDAVNAAWRATSGAARSKARARSGLATEPAAIASPQSARSAPDSSSRESRASTR